MNWFKRKHDYYVTFNHKKGYGCSTFADVRIFDRKKIPTEFKRIVEESNDVEEVMITNWIRL